MSTLSYKTIANIIETLLMLFAQGMGKMDNYFLILFLIDVSSA